MTKTALRKLESKCYQCENELNASLGKLGSAASEILGYNVVADLCSGGSEIEFRKMSPDGTLDSDSCIRIEELLNKL